MFCDLVLLLVLVLILVLVFVLLLRFFSISDTESSLTTRYKRYNLDTSWRELLKTACTRLTAVSYDTRLISIATLYNTQKRRGSRERASEREEK